MFKPITPVSLNSNTFTPIVVPAYESLRTFITQCDSDIDVDLSDNMSGGTIFTMKSGTSLKFSLKPFINDGDINFTLFYAKSASSTPKIQVIQIN